MRDVFERGQAERIELYSKLLSNAEEKYAETLRIVTAEGEFTIADLRRRIDCCAADLIRRGVKPGEHIALWSMNSIDWIAAYFAIVRVHAVACLINFALSAKSVLTLLDYVDVDRIIVGPNKVALQNPNFMVTVATTLNIPAESIIPASALGKQDPSTDELAVLTYLDSVDRPDRDATIIFTTGTTSVPKAVRISQRSILADAHSIDGLRRGVFADPACIALPLFHVFGLVCLTIVLLEGCSFAIAEAPKPDYIIALARRMTFSALATIALVLDKVMVHPEYKELMAPSMTTCVLGGGGVTPDQMRRLREQSGMVILNGYGQTETSSVISVPVAADGYDIHDISVGKPIDCIDLMIADGDGEELPAGEEGEILVKGLSVMNGYYKVPAQRQPFNAAGWLHTGDLGRLDENGYLYLTGRLKDIIIKMGENISPSEIEGSLMRVDGIEMAKVVGVPHPSWGEDIAACIVMKPGFQFNEECVRAVMRQCLDSLKRPTHYLVYEEFPVMGVGKLDMQKLRQDAAEYVAAKGE